MDKAKKNNFKNIVREYFDDENSKETENTELILGGLVDLFEENFKILEVPCTQLDVSLGFWLQRWYNACADDVDRKIEEITHFSLEPPLKRPKTAKKRISTIQGGKINPEEGSLQLF